MPITKKGAQEEHGRAASIFLFFFFRWPAASLALRSNSVVQITGRIEQTDGRAKGVTCNQGKVRKGGAPRPTDREESESVTRTQTVRGYYRKTFSFIGFLSDGLLFIYFFFEFLFSFIRALVAATARRVRLHRQKEGSSRPCWLAITFFPLRRSPLHFVLIFFPSCKRDKRGHSWLPSKFLEIYPVEQQ